MPVISCFAPVIDNCTRLLILGSMPGEESLKKQQYYANPRNHFWRILSSLFQVSIINEPYEKRIISLKERGIGLWDVIGNCSREGSLDSNIRDIRVNDFAALYKEYPNVRCVCFNGLKAFDTYRRLVGFDGGLIFNKLESTSPANTKNFEVKLKNWSIIREYI